jgi:hypothetical protein
MTKFQQTEAASTPELCYKAITYHLIAGASSYACMLPKGHEGECQPGGNCFKHGKYVGATRCPKWPDCATPPIQRPPWRG